MTDETRDVAVGDWLEEVRRAYVGGYRFFDVLTAVDLEQEGFEVVLRLWDVETRRGLLLRTRCPRDAPRLPSLTSLYAGAAWHERAAAELFGLEFEGHTARHLLLSDRFEGHPLRKDFVLAARVAKRWPGAKEPGESDVDLATPRRRPTPPGRPAGWGES